MKRILFLIAIGSLTVFACKNSQNNSDSSSKDSLSTESSQNAPKTEYTCPMHPEVVSDKPGTCPKCGMDLQAKS